MAGASQNRNSDFDRPKQCDRSDYISLDDETPLDDETHDTDQQTNPQVNIKSTSNSSHRSTNDYGNVTIPRYILLILVVVPIVTFMVCATLLMIILLTKIPQNISDAAKEGNVFIYVKRSSPVELPI